MPDGDNLILGTDNTAQSQTSLNRTNDDGGEYGFHVQFEGHAIGGASILGIGVDGTGASGAGVRGRATSGDGVVGGSQSATGVGGGSNTGSGVRGTSFQGIGVEGISFGPGAAVTGAAQAQGTGPGVVGLSDTNFGVRGQSGPAVLLPPVGGGPEFQKCGVQGSSDDGTGVRGDSAHRVGVRGRSFAADGVFGSCHDQPNGPQTTGNGVHGFAPRQSNNGVSGPFAGFFNNDVKVTGRLYVGNTLVAHPLAAQASLTVAAGVVDLDGNGEAVVELPAGLAEMHTDFRYQLTAVGGPAPDLHVADEIRGDSFRIGGGAGARKVSWHVAAEPQDAPAVDEPVAESPYDEKLAQEHGRVTEQLARRHADVKERMQDLLEG